ncbi:MAG: response regulator [Bacteroidota bacterium]
MFLYSTKKQILLLLSVVYFTSLFGQVEKGSYMYETLDSDDGIPNNYVTSLIQDDIGLIWIATESGLTKYDGKEFLFYSTATEGNNPGYSNLETLFKDKDGNLWIGQKLGGVSYLDITTNKITNLRDERDSASHNRLDRILSFAQDEEGLIYAGGWNGGVNIIDPVSMEICGHILNNESIFEIYRDSEGGLWFGSFKVLYHLPRGEQKVKTYKTDMNGIRTIREDSLRCGIWFGGWNGLHFLDTKTGQISTDRELERLSDIAVTSILHDKASILIGTRGKGLYRYYTTEHELLKIDMEPAQRQGLGYNTILDLFSDKYGVVWVSTIQGIVKIIKKQPFFTLRDRTNKTLTETTSMLINDKGLYVGTIKGFNVVSKAKNDFFPLGRINSITSDSSGMLYLCTSSGFYKYDHAFGKPELLIGDLKNVTYYFREKENLVWLCTQHHGVYKYLENNGDLRLLKEYRMDIKSKDGLRSDRAVKLVKDNTGRLWLATFNGLHIYDSLKDNFVLTDQKLASQLINDIKVVGERMYVATSGGLSIVELDREDMKVYTVRTMLGVSNNHINAIELDKDNNIWASTNYGINRYSFINYSVKSFNKSDGLRSNSFNENAVYRTKSGMLYYGSHTGAVYFHPDSISYKTHMPDVIFSKLKINNRTIMAGDVISRDQILEKPVEYMKKITLSHIDKVISIGITPDDYIEKGNIYYKFRLKGFQDKWVYDVNIDEITYTNLNPGKYSLEVFASRDRDRWPKTGSSIGISMIAAPWFSWKAYTMYIIIGLGLLYLFIYLANKGTKLRNKLELETLAKNKEKELTESKLGFFTSISHEFRTPLTLIQGPVEDILANSGIEQNERNKLNLVYKNSRRLMSLINQLLEFRKIETGKEKLVTAKGNIVYFVKEIFLTFKELAADKNIEYILNSQEKKIELWFDRNKLEILVFNLLSNAFKYTGKGGSIEVNIKKDETNCLLSIRDTGKGIAVEDQDKIFDRFYQVKHQETSSVMGSGIGLSLVKNIAELHKGNVSIKSQQGKGSEFRVMLPLGKHHLDSEQIAKDFRNSENAMHYNLISDKGKGEIAETAGEDFDETIPTLLVIDDNPDIRGFVRSLLEREYTVLEAEDGEKGLEIIKSETVDIVISDVMMPGIDGIELCRRIRNDESISHIPLILLTARTSNIYQVSGIKTGADDYITKPFAPEVLRARVANLLSSRERLKDYYSKKIRLEASNIDIPDREAEFITKAIKLVEDNISDTDFTIDNLQNALNMSQSTLYRKIKSLTGETPTGFIRGIRLKYAAQLLSKRGLSVSEVIYSSGFNDSKYFRECFKKQFGCLPSKYIELKKDKE